MSFNCIYVFVSDQIQNREFSNIDNENITLYSQVSTIEDDNEYFKIESNTSIDFK